MKSSTIYRVLLLILLIAGLEIGNRGQESQVVSAQAAEHDPGDHGPALQAFLNFPEYLVITREGDFIVSERGGNRVRKIDRQTGEILTIAGTGEKGFGGDGGPAILAKLNEPTALALDKEGNLYIGDTWNYRIRRVDAKTGIISTIAGNGKEATTGDGGLASEASISGPFELVFDSHDNLYFTDTETHRIRRIDHLTNKIRTIAGNGHWGSDGDGGPAIRASLARPHRLFLLSDEQLLIGDSFNFRIRRVDLATGMITAFAGIGTRGSSGDGGPATEASFCYFGGFARMRNRLLVSGICDHRIRAIDLTTGRVAAFAGSGDTRIQWRWKACCGNSFQPAGTTPGRRERRCLFRGHVQRENPQD